LSGVSTQLPGSARAGPKAGHARTAAIAIDVSRRRMAEL
jgi:hypothetical protein